MGFLEYINEERLVIFGYFIEHLQLTFIAVGLSISLGVPLGIIVFYFKKTSKFIMTLANIIQAIPSLALLGFIIPFLGIGKLPAIVVVTLYSLLPIIKNTYVGLKGIDPSVIEAAKGMGLTNSQILFKIELPIALPIIMTGVRIASVTAVGLVTIAAFIGGGGLGTLIFSGIRSVNTYHILAGSIPAAMLALSIDYIFNHIQNDLDYKVKKSNKGNVNKKLAILGFGLVIAVFMIFRTEDKDIKIASKDYTEQIIIANIIGQLIEEKTDLTVDLKTAMGSTGIVFDAMKNNDVDGYVEYTGTLLVDILKQPIDTDIDSVYNTVSRMMKEKYDFIIGQPIGFNNTYTLSINSDFSQENNLTKISDLTRVQDELVLGAVYEFINREDGLKGLEITYNLSFGKVIPLDGSNRYLALSNGNVNVIDAFSTDGLIKKYDLVVLEDDMNYFIPYYAVTVFSKEILDKHPELNEVLALLDGIITKEKMQAMNYEVDEKGFEPYVVAQEFLKNENLIN